MNIFRTLHKFNELVENSIAEILKSANKKLLYNKYGYPIDVMNQDWDNLIILDACRYDYFEQINDIEGELSKVVSPASQSSEFIQSSFNNKKLHDTVYITANPYADRTLDNNVFHKVIKTYSKNRNSTIKSEDQRPTAVSNVAINNLELYSDKRVIIHYMQPHTPYIGSFAKNKKSELLKSENICVQGTNETAKSPENKNFKNYEDMLRAARDNHITDEELKKMYIENVEIVLNEVKKILDIVDGKTVITADHGEMLGNPSYTFPRRTKYTHPREVYVPELRVVPWLCINSNDRRKIVSEPPEPVEEVSEEIVNERLKTLGYKN